ncbi:hypothetical protein [Viridibacterium curvum]|uniref:Lipoprotein n=1 Tax=Viridibacterium curvum TaxID=1101404 RepID=A0ABP9QTY1_9RHOO
MGKHAYARLTVLAVVLGITACGGGGGGGGSSGGTTATASDSTTITASNQDSVAAVGVQSASLGAGIADNYVATGGDAIVGVEISGAQSDALPDPYAAARLFAQRISTNLSNRVESVTGTTSTSTYTCPGGGYYTETDTYISSLVLSVGDSATFTHFNCKESDGTIYNGTMSGVVTAKSSSTMAVNYTYSALKMQSGSTTVTMSGSFSLATNSIAVTYAVTNGNINIAISTSSFNMGLAYSNINVTSQVSSDGTTTTFTPLSMGVSATVGSNAFGINITAVTPLVTNSAKIVQSGKLKITGKSGILYITFLGSGAVKLELDANGDGVIESTKSTTVAALKS